MLGIATGQGSPWGLPSIIQMTSNFVAVTTSGPGVQGSVGWSYSSQTPTTGVTPYTTFSGGTGPFTVTGDWSSIGASVGWGISADSGLPVNVSVKAGVKYNKVNSNVCIADLFNGVPAGTTQAQYNDAHRVRFPDGSYETLQGATQRASATQHNGLNNCPPDPVDTQDRNMWWYNPH
jgi:hypothetical protein